MAVYDSKLFGCKANTLVSILSYLSVLITFQNFSPQIQQNIRVQEVQNTCFPEGDSQVYLVFGENYWLW